MPGERKRVSLLLNQQNECDANGVQLKDHLNKGSGSSNSGYAEMISSSDCKYGTGEGWMCLGDVDGSDIPEAGACPSAFPVTAAAPIPSSLRRRCHAVRCERVCDPADLGRPDAASVNPVNNGAASLRFPLFNAEQRCKRLF